MHQAHHSGLLDNVCPSPELSSDLRFSGPSVERARLRGNVCVVWQMWGWWWWWLVVAAVACCGWLLLLLLLPFLLPAALQLEPTSAGT